MLHKLNVSRVASQVLNFKAASSFCAGFPLLDPSRHNNMGHMNHNLFEDIYDYGRYPDVILVGSVAPRTYQAQVISIITAVINKNYGTNFNQQFILQKKLKNWNRFLEKDVKTTEKFHEIYPAILARLANEIIVKESRFTWISEQKYRLHMTSRDVDFAPPETIEDFIDFYNKSIEQLVLISNLGFAAEIDQPETALSRHRREQNFDNAPGVEDLKNLPEDKNNFINRLMLLIH